VPDSWRFPHVQDKVELAQGTFESFVRQPGYFRDDVAGQKFRTEDYLMLDSRVPDFVTIAKAEELNIVFPDLTRPFRVTDDIKFPHNNQSGRRDGMSIGNIDKQTRGLIRAKHRWLFDEGFYND